MIQSEISFLLIALLASSTAFSAEEQATVIKTEPGPSYTQPQLNELLSTPKSPTGLVLSDKQQIFASIVADIDTQNPNIKNGNHSGFSIAVYEPAAWLGVLRAKAVKEFKPFGPEDIGAEDKLPVLRVVVRPDSPEYMTAIGVSRANNVEHVVLRSLDRRLVAQPFSVAPTTWTVQNGFGARLEYAGMVAVFWLTDLDKIRAAAESREFFVTIVGERKNSNRDFEIKRKFFDRMGDVNVSPATRPVYSPAPAQQPIPRTIAKTASAPGPVIGPVYKAGVDGVTTPSVLSKTEPTYTELAGAADVTGTVQLLLVVGADGHTHDIHVAKSLGMGLDESAVEAVQTWTFVPAIKDHKPVNVSAIVNVAFNAHNESPPLVQPTRSIPAPSISGTAPSLSETWNITRQGISAGTVRVDLMADEISADVSGHLTNSSVIRIAGATLSLRLYRRGVLIGSPTMEASEVSAYGNTTLSVPRSALKAGCALTIESITVRFADQDSPVKFSADGVVPLWFSADSLCADEKKAWEAGK